MQGLTLSNVDRVEVARGPQSALYGTSAVSGVVHFITRRGELGPPRVSSTFEGGSGVERGGSYQAVADVAGGTRLLKYSAGIGGSSARGIYELPHDTRTLDGSLRLDLTPSDRWSVTGNLRSVFMESNLPVRDPGATRVPLDPNARNERGRVVGSIDARFAPAARWTQQLRATHYHEDFLYQDRLDNVAAEVMTPYFVFDANFMQDSERRRTMFEYGGSYDARDAAAGTGFAFSYGVQTEKEEVTDTTDGDFGASKQRLERSSRAAFAEIFFTPVRRLDVMFGARAEKFEGLDTEMTPRVSAVFDALPGILSLRAAAGRAYKAPNLQEQYLDNPFIRSNPDLAPETSKSWEIGADAQVSDGRVGLSVTYFRQKFENLIRAVQIEGSSQQMNRNLGRSETHGIEWYLRYRSSPTWGVGTDGAWIATEILDNTGFDPLQFPEGKALPFRPSMVASGFVEVMPMRRLTATARGTFIGSQTVLTERFSGDRAVLDSYFLAGLTAAFSATPRVELYTRIDNLFDTEYTTAFDRHGIPLTAALGVRLRN
jgi:vitamin B12 transporter